MHKNSRSNLLPLSALILGSAGSAGAAASFTVIDAPGASTFYPGTFAMAVNASGTIAGYYSDTTYTWHGFVRTPGGVYTTFQVNGFNTTVAAINASGAITGSYFDTTTHGFVRSSAGVITTFDAPGAGNSSDQGTSGANINDAGVIVGYYLDGANLGNGFVRAANGTITTFDAPSPAHSTVANSINASGVVAGDWADPGAYIHGFVRNSSGVITTFDAPGEGAGFIQGTGVGLQVHFMARLKRRSWRSFRMLNLTESACSTGWIS